MFDLEGKVALVTGSCGIIGESTCHMMARLGARVVMVDKNDEKNEKVAAEIAQKHGKEPIVISGDVTSPSGVKGIVDETVDQCSRIDIFNNLTVFSGQGAPELFTAFEDYPYELWNRCMDVNAGALFLLTQAVGKVMLEQGGGSVILMSSIYGMLGPDDRIYEGALYRGAQINTPAHYAFSKGGAISLTRYLATRWGKKGIRVNCVTPGGIQSGQSDTFIENYSSKVPMGYMGKPEDIASAIAYLASDASAYVTGHNLVVDGGYSAW